MAATYDQNPRSFDSRSRAVRQQNLAAYLQAALQRAQPQQAAAPTPTPQISDNSNAQTAGAGATPVAAPAGPAPTSPQGQLNQQFDAQAALLHRIAGDARTGIGATGNQLNSQLSALAHDSAHQSGLIGNDIRSHYAAQRGMAGQDNRALMADLMRNGADTSVLNATNHHEQSLLGDEATRQGALQKRLQQVLGATMSDRQAGGRETTAGTQQQLTEKEALMAAQVEQQRMAAMQQLEQSLQAARSSGGGHGGGGGGGGSGSGGMTDAQRLSLNEKLAAMTGDPANKAIDFGKLALQSGALGRDYSGDTAGAQRIANDYVQQLSRGANANTLMVRYMMSQGLHGNNDLGHAGRLGNFDPTPIHDLLANAIYQQQHQGVPKTADQKRKAYLQQLMQGY